MTDVSPLGKALLIGAVTGLRSMTSLAALGQAVRRGELDLRETPFVFLSSPVAAGAFALLAAGELGGDKLPGVPSRKSPLPFLGRVAIGALCGAALCAQGRRSATGAVAGALGAAFTTIFGYEARKRLVAAIGGKDYPVALLEDALAMHGAAVAISPVRPRP